MNGEDLLRYERLLIEKRQELRRATTSAGALVPAAGHVEGDPVDKATAEAEANLQIQLHRADGATLASHRRRTEQDQPRHLRLMRDVRKADRKSGERLSGCPKQSTRGILASACGNDSDEELI